MGTFAKGKRSLAISDRSGMAFPYPEMVREWNGSLVHTSEFEPKHPQIRRKRVVADAIALQNSRAQDFQQPEVPFQNDDTIAGSGGQGQAVANLTLPGQFAFQVFQTETINGEINSMQPRDPSLQNIRRQAKAQVGEVTVGIS
jgi:hypothetical protein